MNTEQNNGKAINNITAVNKGWKHGDSFIVGVKDGKKPEILVNRDEEDVMLLGYNIIHKGTSYAKAEKAVNSFIRANTSYCVVKFTNEGITDYKVFPYEGVITTAPFGTVGICRCKEEACILARKLLNNEKIVVPISATA